jgi:Mlc titration factor MtfA (ptsG expression regulator)
MQQQQQELWAAEPYPIPPLYQQLTPEQRSRLVDHLARLLLKMVRANSSPPNPPTPKSHER